MRRASLILMGAVLVVAAGCRSAARAPATDVVANAYELEPAKADFYLAVEGDSAALKRALAYFEEAHGRRPEWSLGAAYLGATKLLAAREAFLPWEKGRLSKEGLALLDGAVEAQPGDVEVRFVRGMTTRRLPGFMKRGSVAEEDLALVAAEVEAAVEEGRLHPRLAAAALHQYGVLLRERGDHSGAARAWQRAVKVAPEAPGGRAAQRELER